MLCYHGEHVVRVKAKVSVCGFRRIKFWVWVRVQNCVHTKIGVNKKIISGMGEIHAQINNIHHMV